MSERRDELRANLLDPMSRRPWLDEDGSSKITVKSGDVRMSRPSPVPAKLTKAQWLQADEAILKAFWERCPLTCCLREQNAFDMRGQGLAKTVLEFEEMTDGETVSKVTGLPMPTFKLTALPLPITSIDLRWAAWAKFDKFLEVCESAGRRVGEAVERTLLNGWRHQSAPSGAAEVLGLTNCGKPVRFGGTIKASSAIKLLYNRKFYGPFVVVTDADVNTHEQRQTDRRNLLALEGVQDVIATPALKAGESVIVQVTPDVVRIVLGLDVALMQWDEGFKVACCIVPQVRCDCHGNVGVAVKRVKP